MIKDITGHRSSKALSLYERPSLAQNQAVSKVMAGNGSFSEEVQKIQSKDSQEVAIPSTSQTKTANLLITSYNII